ncbi:asparagine synthetase B family protein [Thalassotalea sp. 1_MG-2023]|uniref:asparagine synthase family protein n=1 Tax=Thalassotalea sp. 1_MG-2023 TaxID=3062680 RepID=UPI0026E49449|nr:asparagine synthetase B family protein [Thalassotalea sp. 1_MG-2023]MDO6426506.1 asparagine synthetase B family protein [Thalassotalea sp. 1_MG-2023]
MNPKGLQADIKRVDANIDGLFGNVETIEQKFYYIGQAFVDEKPLTAAQLYKQLKAAITSQSISSLLAQLSGFYSLVLIKEGHVLVACDKTRSRPLFYALDAEHTLCISDSVALLVNKVGADQFSKISEQEFQLSGYVTGSDTLLKDVYQVQAGHMLFGNYQTVEQACYFQFKPDNNNSVISQALLYSELDIAMTQAIEQLITYANGRQLVVPLSGGYDSRAIAVYLKKSGYENIVTFTFGRMSSKEVVISKRIADSLGFPWHFVEYDSRLWSTIEKSSLFNEYLMYISNFVSVPNVQVYPAIKAIFEQGVIDKDAVVVPGHTGDFVSGGHIPHNLIGKLAKDHEDMIIETIKSRHFKNKVKKVDFVQLNNKLRSQVRQYTENMGAEASAASVFESWEFFERQAKFIVNSNRYYDFFKLDWWMPLWNESVISFWQKTPVEHRINSKLWQNFVEDKYSEISGDDIRYGNVADQYSPKLRRLRTILDYFTDENGLYALVPFYRWLLRKLKYPYANGTLFSYLAMKVLKIQKHKLKTKAH